MSFCTAINCMDGRVQLPVISCLKESYQVDFVDCITEAGPVRLLADEPESPLTLAILNRVEISVKKHHSRGIAVAAHFDCAGNNVSDQLQKEQLSRAAAFLSSRYPDVPVITLWVGADWKVEKLHTKKADSCKCRRPF